MGLNTEVATRLAEDRLAEWRRRGYAELRDMLDRKESCQVTADDGKRYMVVTYALDDGDGRIRMCVAVDDGGRSAYRPLVRVEIMRPDGSMI